MNNKIKNVTEVTISVGTITRIIVAIAIVAALIVMKDIVLVFLTSLVIASFVRAVSRKLSKHKVPRTLSVVGVYFIIFAAIATIFYFFLPILIIEISNLLPLVAKFLPAAGDTGNLNGITNVAQNITDKVPFTDVVNSLKSFLGSMSTGIFQAVGSIFGGIVNLVLIIVISFYLSLEQNGIESFLRIATPARYEDYVIDLWGRSQRKIARWFKGQLMLGLIVGLLTFIGLSLLGVQYALLISVMAGILELIPFGIILAAVPAISFGFASGGFPLALAVAGLYFGIQQLEGYVFQPLIVNRVTGVSPILVILSVLVGFSLAGIWGLILAVPVAVTILEYVSDFEKDKIERKLANIKKRENESQ